MRAARIARPEEGGLGGRIETGEVGRQRAGQPDALRLRTLARLPVVADGSVRGAAGALVRAPAIRRRRGGALVAIRPGTHDPPRHPDGRHPESRPGHPDPWRDAPRRVGAAAWARGPRVGVGARSERRLVRGQVSAIAGSGLGATPRVVTLVGGSAARPVIVAGRPRDGTTSEQGKEAHLTRAVVEPARALGGAGTMRLLLATAVDADGPLVVWRSGVHGIAARVRRPADRWLDQDLAVLAAGNGLIWHPQHDTRPVRGHNARRRGAAGHPAAAAAGPT